MVKKVTIHDLARELGVNSSTVSRALSDNHRVGKKTKEKIKLKAKEMGYQRNLMASNLRMRKTMTIGVVVPFISRHVFSQVIDGIEQIATENNYRVIIAQSHDDAELEEKIVEGLFMNRIDGLLISHTHSKQDDKHLKIFVDNEIPVVLFDRYFEDSEMPKVILEDRKAAFEVVNHVIKSGKKDILLLAGNIQSKMYNERFNGFKEALEINNIEFDESKLKLIPLYAKNAVEVVAKIIKKGTNIPDAIVCANDITAMAVLKYITDHTNLKIPEDIAVSGFSDEPAAKLINPGLTTIDQHPFEMGKVASKLLVELMSNKEESKISSQTIVIKSDLIVRGSTQS